MMRSNLAIYQDVPSSAWARRILMVAQDHLSWAPAKDCMLQEESNEPLTAPLHPPGETTRPAEEHAAALERLAEEFRELRELVVNRLSGGVASRQDGAGRHAGAESSLGTPSGYSADEPCGEPPENSLLEDALRRLDESAEENSQLREQLHELQAQLAELEQQNDDLASQVAGSNIRKSVSDDHSDCTEALSWEDRKALILQQMESDSFDSQAFVEKLSSESAEEAANDPAGYVEQLHREMQRRDEEINELRCLLEQQGGAREGDVAIGAAAIAQMVDSDELVQEERRRLQQLQAEWEEKFRQGEIAASLERAKLSRERQELARKNEELEEQLAHLRRECRSVEAGGGPSRRWLAKLGLSEAEE